MVAVPKKFKRRSRNVFHKRNTRPLKILSWCVAGALVVCSGVLVAKWAATNPFAPTPASSAAETESNAPASAAPAPSSSETPEPEPSLPGDGTTKSLRAVVIDTALLADTAALDPLLEQAAAAGFNGVVFDLKDNKGCLHYASAVEQGAAVLRTQASRLAADQVLPMETLLAAAAHLREKGFEPVPRLYAFKDQVAPYALANVKIGVEGSPASVWHDANPSKGGVPWMNPCSTDAHRYMSALAGELKTAGFSLVLLDGVQFPDREYSADYGSSELAGLPRGQVLSRFVGGIRDILGDGLILGMPALAATGDATKPFGDNPLVLGAPNAAPLVGTEQFTDGLTVAGETIGNPAAAPYETVRRLLEQLNLRVGLIESGKQPLLLPVIGNAEEARAVRDALGEASPYLYRPASGQADFSGF